MGGYEVCDVFPWTKIMFAEVSFSVPIDTFYHYKIPSNLKEKIFPGSEVLCSFGKSFEKRGIVVGFSDALPQGIDEKSLKEIRSIAYESLSYPFDSICEVVKESSLKWYSPQGLYYGLFYENSYRETDKLKQEKYLISRYRDENEMAQELEKGSLKKLVRGDFDFELSMELAFNKAEKGGQTLFLTPDYLTAMALYKKISILVPTQSCALFHGSLTPKKKKEIFAGILSGRIQYIIGPKSALFLPYSKESLFIVISAESDFHEQMEQRPFYDAVEMAILLSESFSHRIILFSPFPRLEMTMPDSGFEIIKKTKILPSYTLHDAKKNDFKPLSSVSIDKIKENIEKGGKSLIICSAKGFAFKSFCPVCGWVAKCKKCKVNLRLYKDEEGYHYKCPMCMEKSQYSSKCPSCNTEILKTGGYGTQKIAEFISENISSASILRIDSDIVKKSLKGQEKLYEELILGKYQILVGTSLLLSLPIYSGKFKTVIFAGFNPDKYSQGFRESEISFQRLLTGASLLESDGNLIVESFELDNPIFSYGTNYDKFLCDETETRHFFLYPPFCQLLGVRLFSKDREELRKFALYFASLFTSEKMAELEILLYRHTEKIRTDKRSGISSHTNFFKIASKSKKMRDWLFSFNFPKSVKILIKPGEF